MQPIAVAETVQCVTYSQLRLRILGLIRLHVSPATLGDTFECWALWIDGTHASYMSVTASRSL